MTDGVRELDHGAVPALIVLWDVCGLTRPWNDPRRDAERAIDAADAAIQGIEREDALVASVMVGFDGHRGWVYYVAVLPRWRGGGLGRMLMAAAEAWLRARGAPKLQLMVRTDNTAAAGFYAALGLERQPVVTYGRVLDPLDR